MHRCRARGVEEERTVVAAAGDAAKAGVAERLGIKPGMVVQELGLMPSLSLIHI